VEDTVIRWLCSCVAFTGLLYAASRPSATEDRVARARDLAGETLEAKFERAGVPYPPARVFFRAYKREAILELWADGDAAGPLRLVHAYPIAFFSGGLGPKRIQGDKQVPEGLYHIDRFNPQSRFRLSLGINYPNASDRIRSDKTRPGGDIFIHGDRKSIGCLAMTDALIDEIYLAALDARAKGQSRIPVFIFPTRMTRANLNRIGATHPQHKALWNELAVFDREFERTKEIPRFTVDRAGVYRLNRG
jgi:murein L,D-transpeptidase YafK